MLFCLNSMTSMTDLSCSRKGLGPDCKGQGPSRPRKTASFRNLMGTYQDDYKLMNKGINLFAPGELVSRNL